MEALLRPTTDFSAPTEPTERSLEALLAALDLRIPGIAGHCRRVSRAATATAQCLELAPEPIELIRRAAAVHDVGKIEMPAGIVNKPGPLSPAEYAIVRKHAAAGARLVAPHHGEEVATIVRHHHERFDGEGYPFGLIGAEIPLGSRIVAVADTFDALTSTRPYRGAMRPREAIAVLRAEAGSQLDPDVVEAFCARYAGTAGALRRAIGR